MTHIGDCRGGPNDGQRLTHWGNSKTFWQPKKSLSATNLEGAQPNTPIDIVPLGEYVWHVNFWRWVPAK